MKYKILDLIAAMGPQSLEQIRREVRIQYVGDCSNENIDKVLAQMVGLREVVFFEGVYGMKSDF